MSKGIRPIIREHIPPLLYEVLRKNKCIGKYIENTYKYCKQLAESNCNTRWYPKKEYQRYLRSIAKSRAENVILAFNWAETPEGISFWLRIDAEYKEYMYQTK